MTKGCIFSVKLQIMTNGDAMKHYAVVMAGGRGERFWPAGRLARPKQLISFGREGTMLEDTVQRLFPFFAVENILVVTGSAYAEKVAELLPIPSENIICEPARRNTTGCIALAAAEIRRREQGGNAVMTALPADHVITPVTAFHAALRLAEKSALNGKLVTIGVIPSRPDTGYGYIKTGRSVETGIFEVDEFKEKPDAATAREYFLSGNYRWNSGIFVWQNDVIIDNIARNIPEIGSFIEEYASAADCKSCLEEKFSALPSVAIDYAVLEHSREINCVEGSFYWNDLGSWSSLFELDAPDEDGNVSRGRNILVDTRHCVVCGDDSTLIGVIGMRDAAIIKSGNGILVCPLSEEQSVREIIKLASDDPDLAGFV